MPRLLPAALAVLLTAPALAQSDLSPSPVALGASGTYAGVVATRSFASLSDLRAPGVSLDATYGRLSLGAGVAFYEYDTPVGLSAGVHLARRPQDHLATTLGVAVSTGDHTFVTPTLSHQQRAFGGPGLAVVPGASVGLAVGTVGRTYNALTPVAAAQLGVVVGRGPTRAVVAPQVGWTGGEANAVALGLSAGLTRGLRRR